MHIWQQPLNIGHVVCERVSRVANYTFHEIGDDAVVQNT